MTTSTPKLDMRQTCRLCLAQGGVLSPIFHETVGGGGALRRSPPQPALPLRIMACAPIQIVEGDELPAQICHRCLYQVERSYDFKEQCENSDRFLRLYIAQVKDEETEVSNDYLPEVHKDEEEENDKSLDILNIACGNHIQDDKPMNYSTTKDKFVKDGVISQEEEQKPSAQVASLIKAADYEHNSTFGLQEDDVDSGLLESLADSEDLQIVGSEGGSVALTDVGSLEQQTVDRAKEEFTDKSESSDEEIHFRCKMCKDTFTDIDVLESHEAEHEANGPPFLCAICDKTFSERSSLDSHWLVHCGDHPFSCPVCESPFASNEALESHLCTHKISRPYSCATCDKSFGNRSDLKKHAVIHTGLRPYKCKICPKEFSRSTNLNKHLRVHSGQRPFTCGECPKMFRTKGDLHRHEIIHTGQKPFSCPICQLSFNRKDKLTRHERLHSVDKVFTCTMCSSSFIRRDELAKHSLLCMSLPEKFDGKVELEQEVATDLSMPSKKELTPELELASNVPMNDDESTMDTESDNQLHICEDPEDEDSNDQPENSKDDMKADLKVGVESMVINVDPFQMERMDTNETPQSNSILKASDFPTNLTISYLKSEMEKEEFSPNENDVEENIQENTKPYGCEFCPKKFADKSYMKTHQLTHLGIRPHACSYCGKGFFRRRELLRHEAVHTGIKPFSCKTCQKAFARSDKLMRHERTHGEPKNFSCTQCPAVFSRKDELSRHAMCHTGERPHCCSQCFKSFFSKAELTRHEKTHAGLKPFKCDFCEQSFHRRDKLNRHVRTHMNAPTGPSDASVLGTVHLHELLAHCGQHFAAEVRSREEKAEGEEFKVRVDGSIDARALARLNQNPDIHLIPLKQN